MLWYEACVALDVRLSMENRKNKMPDNAKRRHSIRCTVTLHKHLVIEPWLTAIALCVVLFEHLLRLFCGCFVGAF